MRSLFLVITLALSLKGSNSFTMQSKSLSNAVIPSSTKLFLEDKIAEMIDLELLRLSNKEEYEKQWKAKNEKVIEPVLPTNFDFNDFAELNNDDTIELRRDRRMVRKNPAQYCADRCVSTGHCEVFEDMLDMGPQEVMKFCTDCVLSEEEEPCDIPEAMFADDYPELSLRP